MVIPTIIMIATTITATAQPGKSLCGIIEGTTEEEKKTVSLSDVSLSVSIDDVGLGVGVAVGTVILVYAAVPFPNVLLGVIHMEYADPNVAPPIVIVGDEPSTSVLTKSPLSFIL
jgi:hypothetical protein